MGRVEKRQWLEGLILMAINSTLAKKDKSERTIHKMKVTGKVADIILEQFNDEKLFE